jgi:hypothetical protein
MNTDLRIHIKISQAAIKVTVRKIWGFNAGDYEEHRPLECDTVWLL